MPSSPKLKIVLATRNSDKIREIRDVLNGLDIDILTLDQFPGIPEVVEDGETIEENALKKAKAVSDVTHLLALADDTGLEVDYLGGQPGVYSSRFAGENATYDDNCNKLLNLMKDVPDDQRTARFRCVIAMTDSQTNKLVEGVCEGIITGEKRGTEALDMTRFFMCQSLIKLLQRLLWLKKIKSVTGDWHCSKQKDFYKK